MHVLLVTQSTQNVSSTTAALLFQCSGQIATVGLRDGQDQFHVASWTTLPAHLQNTPVICSQSGEAPLSFPQIRRPNGLPGWPDWLNGSCCADLWVWPPI